MSSSRSYEAPVEAGHVLLFARSLGDTDTVYTQQLSNPAGSLLHTPLTFVRALDHFDPGSATRPILPSRDPSHGGSGDTVHAEQHFEYFEPMRVGDRAVVASWPHREWTKEGRSGSLRFTETVTEYRNQHGLLLVRATKVSVRTLSGAES